MHHRLDGRRTWLIHRLVYRLAHGVLPEHVHHECRRRLCCNPAHLIAIYPAEHSQLHHPLGETCRAGHLMTEANTYVRRDTGGRQCRRCKADRERDRIAGLPQAERKALIDARTERRRRARSA